MKDAKQKKGGRPSSYRPEFADQAYRMALLGLIDTEMASVFGVTEQTLNNWKIRHPEFFEALKKGKILADANVSASLYQRAIGYEHEDVHFSSYEGIVTATKFKRRYPPDTAAAFIWLKNRQSALWRDKNDDPAGGAPLPSSVKVTVEDASVNDADA